MKSLKLLLILLISQLIVTSLVAEKIKIGVSTPLSWDAATYGIAS